MRMVYEDFLFEILLGEIVSMMLWVVFDPP